MKLFESQIKGTEPPQNLDTTIWRYMDFAKFMAMIDKNMLYFACVDKLEDQYEGHYPLLNTQYGDLNSEVMKIRLKQIEDNQENVKISMINRDELSSGDADYLKKAAIEREKQSLEHTSKGSQMMIEATKKYRKRVFINSWHIQEYESVAMWDLYSKKSSGIAVKTTYGKFKNAIIDDKFLSITAASVNYIDYQMNAIPMNYLYSPFIFKRKNFEHEREFRALIIDMDHHYNLHLPSIYGNGIEVKVNLHELINQIYVAPTADHWIMELIKSVINKYQLDKEVIQSNLASAPIY